MSGEHLVYMVMVVMFPFPFHLPSLEYIHVLFQSNLGETSQELNEMPSPGPLSSIAWVLAEGPVDGWASQVALVRRKLPASAGDVRPGFNPWVGRTPWRRAWQPTPIFLLGKIPWTEEPGGLQSVGS